MASALVDTVTLGSPAMAETACTQALPVVEGEPRRGRTPAEEQLWMHLHEVYVQEVKQLEKTVRSLTS